MSPYDRVSNMALLTNDDRQFSISIEFLFNLRSLMEKPRSDIAKSKEALHSIQSLIILYKFFLYRKYLISLLALLLESF